jgi:hypothetical protein
MTCHEAQDLIDAIAAADIGEPAAFAAHVADCRSCAAALAMARRIEGILATQPEPGAPADFTRRVAGAIRRRRWEHDEHVDRAFNVAIGVGVGLIVVAVVSLLNVSALSQLLMAAANAVAELPNETPAWPAVSAVPMAGIGMSVVVTAIGVWWWAERRSDLQGG